MDFDERIIGKKHVSQAIDCYLSGNFKHAPAKSAFLLHKGKRLPAKFILRLAFKEATDLLPHPETLTGGRASIRVLQNLGFEVIYDKPIRNTTGRNPVKSSRREALRQILSAKWGTVETEKRFSEICVPDLVNRNTMSGHLIQILHSTESHRNIMIRGRKNLALAFDFYLPQADLVIEFDERQHFTPLRANSLRAYPKDIVLGFDKKRWIQLSDEIRAGDNSPIYRDEQRAFYDSIRDIMASKIGLRPVVRIFEDDVHWEKDGGSSKYAIKIIHDIEILVRQ
jgi:hypothetical protein